MVEYALRLKVSFGAFFYLEPLRKRKSTSNPCHVSSGNEDFPLAGFNIFYVNLPAFIAQIKIASVMSS